mmetsp:Transcript_11912/g.20690  ORF Transcript_11912/g.20690 Transcript_11912/m.20690 type:complete len:212 (-) Transcript_11912:271-906(-)
MSRSQDKPTPSPCNKHYPRPTKGCLVGITVLSNTFASFGKLATVATNFPRSSGSTNPSSFALRSASSADMRPLRTFPGSIKQTATTPFPTSSLVVWVVCAKCLPSRERERFNAANAHLEVKYGTECNRGACRAILPMLMIRPPDGFAILDMAHFDKMNGAMRLISMTWRRVSAETLAMGSFPSEQPAQLMSKSNLFSDCTLLSGVLCSDSK